MQTTLPNLNGQRWESRRFVAVALLGLFLLVKAFAVSESLHSSLHSDAASPSHHCVITLLSQGHLAAPALLVTAVLAVYGTFFLLSETKSLSFADGDFAMAPIRGPPCR